MPVPFGYIESLTHAPSQLGGTPALQRGAEAMQQRSQFEREQAEVERTALEQERMRREQETGRQQRAALTNQMAFFTLGNKYAAAAAKEKEKAVQDYYQALKDPREDMTPHINRLKKAGIGVRDQERATPKPDVARAEKEKVAEGLALEPGMTPEMQAWKRQQIDAQAKADDVQDQAVQMQEQEIQRWAADKMKAQALEEQAALEQAAAAGGVPAPPAPQAAPQPQAPAAAAPQPVQPQAAPAQAPQPQAAPAPQAAAPPQLTPQELQAQAAGIDPSLAGDMGRAATVLVDEITGEEMIADQGAIVLETKRRAVAKFNMWQPIGAAEEAIKAEAMKKVEAAAGKMDADAANVIGTKWARDRIDDLRAGEREVTKARATSARAGIQHEKLELARVKQLDGYIKTLADGRGYKDAIKAREFAIGATSMMSMANPIAQHAAIVKQVKSQQGRPSDYDVKSMVSATGVWDELERVYNKIKFGDKSGQTSERYQKLFLQMTHAMVELEDTKLEKIGRFVQNRVDNLRVYDKVFPGTPGGSGAHGYQTVVERGVARSAQQSPAPAPDDMDDDDVDAVFEEYGYVR